MARTVDLRWVKYLVIICEVLLIGAAYSVSGFLPELFGGRALFPLALGLAVAANGKVGEAVIFGAVCGVIADFISFGSVGVYSFTLTVCCFVVSSLLHSRFRSNFLSATVLAFLSILLIVFSRYLVSAIDVGFIGAGVLFLQRGVAKIVLTFLCFALLYPLNRLISRIGGRDA